MPHYEVFIKPGFRRAEIEANNQEAAAKQFAEIIAENISSKQIETNNLDTDDGRDPV